MKTFKMIRLLVGWDRKNEGDVEVNRRKRREGGEYDRSEKEKRTFDSIPFALISEAGRVSQA